MLVVRRYTARNPLRAELVHKAKEWPWPSLGQFYSNLTGLPVAAHPLTENRQWLEHVNEPQQESEIGKVRAIVFQKNDSV